MVEHRTADDRLLRWEQRSDPHPLLVGQVEIDRLKNLHLWAVENDCSLSCPSSSVTRFGNRSMVPTKGRPGQAEGEALRWLDQCKEETTDLGDGQWEEIAGPPFSAPFAVRRVTSRYA